LVWVGRTEEITQRTVTFSKEYRESGRSLDPLAQRKKPPQFISFEGAKVIINPVLLRRRSKEEKKVVGV